MHIELEQQADELPLRIKHHCLIPIDTFTRTSSDIEDWIVQLIEYCVGFLETRLI